MAEGIILDISWLYPLATLVLIFCVALVSKEE